MNSQTKEIVLTDNSSSLRLNLLPTFEQFNNLLFSKGYPIGTKIKTWDTVINTDEEYQKVLAILNDLHLNGCKDIVLIDATDNKASASNVG